MKYQLEVFNKKIKRWVMISQFESYSEMQKIEFALRTANATFKIIGIKDKTIYASYKNGQMEFYYRGQWQ